MSERPTVAEIPRTVQAIPARKRNGDALTANSHTGARRRNFYSSSSSITSYEGPTTRAASRRRAQGVSSRRTSANSSRRASMVVHDGDLFSLSEMYHATEKFWTSLLDQDSWPFKWTPLPGVTILVAPSEAPEEELTTPNIAATNNLRDDMHNDSNSEAEGIETDVLSQQAESVLGRRPDHREHLGSVTTVAQSKQSMHLFMLSQEYDKMRLWKLDFDDELLNSLFMSGAEVGRSVLESLLCIAEALLCVAVPPGDNPEISAQDGDRDSGQLHKTTNELRCLVERGRKLIATAPSIDEVEELGDSTMSDTVDSLSTIFTQSSNSQNKASGATDVDSVKREISKSSLLEQLKSGVKRLQQLSFPIRLSLLDMRHSSGNLTHSNSQK